MAFTFACAWLVGLLESLEVLILVFVDIIERDLDNGFGKLILFQHLFDGHIPFYLHFRALI